MRMVIDLIDAEGLLKVYQNNPHKLSNAIKFALEDAEYIFNTLQRVAGVDKDEEDFFVELQCKQGATVTLLVSKVAVEFENVACNYMCNRESRCKNKLQWLINFRIVSPYIEYLWRNNKLDVDGEWKLKSPSKIKNIA